MRKSFKSYIWALAIAIGVGITGGTVHGLASWAVAAPGQDQDYSKNKKYQQGMREGRDDRAKNKDHSRKHHFAKDDDQKAYEAGYQHGHTPDH